MFAALLAVNSIFVLGIVLLGILVAMVWLSLYYYCRAKELAPYWLQLEDLQKRIAEAQNTLSEIRQMIKGKQDELANAERAIAEGKAAQKWLTENGARIEALRQENETLKQKLKDANDAYQKRQEELDSLTQQVADKNTELKTAVERKDRLATELARLENEIKAKEQSIAPLELRGKELCDDISRKEAKIRELDAAIEKGHLERNRLDAEVKALEARVGAQAQQLKENGAHLNDVRAETANLTGQAAAAQKILSELAKTTEMNDERWRDLDRPVITASKRSKWKPMNEKDWLEEFEQLLRNHGFVFNERSLQAFHTGLKCAEHSPLVVLAGISGTGKSLLPELYAAALGINFLPVAVQPRWDSPQDLFGFYNYMEGRYKATELSRLLWQFDRYNNANKSEIATLNLILLDEMNLARVEYYFSDLLSKLEIRKGIDPEKPEERRKAEIELENNASAKQEQTRRLFVSLDNLFIGTMNEDESTQMLSDKVLDRANVIRFGRPAKLADAPDKNSFLAECDRKPCLDAKSWRLWGSQELQPKDKRELEASIERLNAAVSEVGRPFGHRVSQAIRVYVSHYPGAFKDALADQIEMKVLPKLNGLDGQTNGFGTTMDKLQGFIDGLGDVRLVEAFQKARMEAADSFFKWRGVMR